MKKILALTLAIGLIMGLGTTALAAQEDTVEQTIRALGIITGDTGGNMNLDDLVTRAQFAKMMVAASPMKDSVGSGSGVSPFSDVKYYHWAAEYIKTAVSAGWLVGYVDGSFKPESNIRAEEAATAVLRMLGFTAADLVGTYPSAQLSKYQALGLDDGVSATQGQAMTRRDCMYLFYNLMSAKNKSGMVYASTLGYTVTMAGQLDYASLVNQGLKGPFIAQGGDLAALVPFGLSTAEIYRSGAAASADALQALDVVYYHENMRTVWIYTGKAVGIYTAAVPSADAPTSVVVGGNTYSVGTTAAAYKLSTMGQYSPGDTVTLILGRNGEIVEVLDGAQGSGVYYGVVATKNTTSYTDSQGNKAEREVLGIACTDGITREFDRQAGSYSVGTVVAVSIDKGQVQISRASSKSISGTVNASGTRLGDTPLAPDAQIIDSTAQGRVMPVYASRLAGYRVTSGSVRFYALNQAGEISHLILDDATGDMAAYGVITSVQETDTSLGDYGSVQIGVYQYLINGTSGTYTSDKLLRITAGPAEITLAGTGISGATALKEHKLDEANGTYAMAGNRRLDFASASQTYILRDGVYTQASVGDVTGSDKYQLFGYTDSGYGLGGKIRVLVAQEK